MQTDNRFIDDLARLASGALGSAAAVRDEIEARVRQRLESILVGMDLVRRDEFEAVKAMAVAARTENEALASRLATLEGARKRGPKGREP
jgi:hypothetical protein